MKLSLVVVDDDSISRQMIENILIANGYEVRGAENALEALDLVHTRKPNAILLDVVMPQMSGIELLAKLKADAATADIPIILVTSKGQDEDLLCGYRYGADYYIIKPFTARQLVYGVRLVLGEEAGVAGESVPGPVRG